MDPIQRFWDKVYQDNTPKLIGICRRYVANRELAEDLVHDAFITAINKYNTYSGKGSFEGWLRRVVINTALMHLRKERNSSISFSAVNDDADTDSSDMPEPNDIRSLIENASFSDDDLLQAIDQLPDHFKMVFNLYVFDNFSHRQIAAALNISEGTSKSHLARARKRLQNILYQKIMSDKKEHKIKVALFIPFTAKANYIDKLFKTQLKGLTIDPTKNLRHFMSRADWKMQTYSAIIRKQVLFSTFQATKFFVLPSLVVLTTVYSVNQIVKDDHKAIPAGKKTDIQLNQTTHFRDSANFADTEKTEKTVPIIDSSGSFKKTPSENPDTMNKKTVIVKKTIIQRQTVTVKKTIQVYDSTKNK